MSAIATGMVFIHSCPNAMRQHVEWAISRALARPSTLSWSTQPALREQSRAEYHWMGSAGSAALVASELAKWSQLRFEVTENSVDGRDGGRWCYTPSLGMYSSQTDALGNLVVPENRLRAVAEFAQGDADLLGEGIRRLLGDAWDLELDVFRQATDSESVRWLNRVG